MRLLFDSHTLLWALYEPEHLTTHVRDLIADEGNPLFVSYASIWELSNKASAYRLPMVGSSARRMVERIQELGVTFLPITIEDILSAGSLPQHHADPFDRMLIAQAQTHSLSLLTRDADIGLYDVPTLWR